MSLEDNMDLSRISCPSSLDLAVQRNIVPQQRGLGKDDGTSFQKEGI